MLTIKILIFLLGLAIGSFLNVCIYRIPANESIAYPPSHCPKCSHKLSALDLIPVLGYIINLGRCRYCKEKISLQYPIIELFTAVLFLFLFERFGLSIYFAKYAVLASLLIVIASIDLKTQEIPDRLIVFGLIAGLLFNLYNIRINMVQGLLGFILGGGSFLIIAMVTKGAMGGGDIKLMAVLGLFFGWQLTILIALISFVLGAFISLILITAKIKGRKDYIPFGPFIAAAAIIALFYGHQILELYLQSIT
ncbi:MAG: Prepilin peptidase [Clostridia bacterium]|jgi:leader peptidase (prepilin peptidase)/N-methyltransferase|nr:Prepilin peptidase [Clostridia bacterium]